MGIASFFEILIIAILGAIAVPTPFGITPLPENPALLRAAPEDAVFYVEWFGTAAPDPKSRNRTERLAAEPEVRTFVTSVKDALRGAITRDEDMKEVGPIFDAVVTCLSRPGCVFLFDVDFDRLDMAAGIVIDLGEHTDTVRRGMEQLAKLADDTDDGMAKAMTVTASSRAITFKPIDQDDEIWWTIDDGMLAIAFGTEGVSKVAAGLDPPEGRRGLDESARYRAAQARAAVARPTSRSYVDLHALYEAAIDSGAGGFVRAGAQLGLDDVQAFVAESGLEGDGFVQRIAFAADEDLRLLELFDGEALTAQDFASVPADAIFALGLSGSPADILEDAFELANSIVVGTGERARSEIFDDLDRELGIDTQADLLAHIGDKALLWSAPSQGGNLLLNGLTLAIELDDAQAFEATFSKVMDKAKSELAKQADRGGRSWRRRRVDIEMAQHGQTKMWMLDMIRMDSIAAPTFAVTKEHLLIGLFPQTLRAQLDRADNASSLAQDADLSRHLGDDNRRAVGYVDMGRAWDLAYPLLQIGAQLACGELQAEGLDLDMRAFPTYGSIAPHLGREYVHVDLTSQSVTVTRSGVLPFSDPFFGLGGAIFLARIQASRMMHTAVRAVEAAPGRVPPPKRR